MTLTRRGLDEIADELEAMVGDEARAAYRPRYNVAPTDRHPVLRVGAGGRRLDLLRWGLPAPGGRRAPLVNARAETAPLKASFREAYVQRRCVVPADGFYEWRAGAGGARQPIWFHRPDGGLLLLAGLWEADRFVVLTTAPNALVRAVHDRMPAVLSPQEAAAWLAAPARALLHPAPEGLLAAREVSPRVNSVAHDDPGCLTEVTAAPPSGGQLPLFPT